MALSRRTAALLAATAVLVGGSLTLGTSADAAAPRLTADRTTGLQAGSAVTLTGSGYTPGQAISVLQCREGEYRVGAVITKPVSYSGVKLARWDADCNQDEPDPKIDNSGRQRLGVADAKGQMSITYYVKDGDIPSKRPDTAGKDVQVSYTCDEESPCELVVIDPSNYVTLQSLAITFGASASTACAAPTDTTPSGTGPYSMTATYQRWAAASCATGTASPLLADYTDTGEAAGLSAFAAGQSDFAVTATGFTGPGGSDVENSRPAVLTPLATTAAVIAYDGGSTLLDTTSYRSAPDPVTDLSLSQAEVAQLFSSPFGTSAQKSPALVARNPQLKKITARPGGTQATLMSPDGVIATPDATVLAMTTAWAAVPDSPWKRGVLRAFPSSLGTGASDSSSIPLLSTLPALTTRVLGSTWTGHAAPAAQVFLYLTDSATAARLGLHVAKLQNASGAFVAPTAESIAAGVKGMKAGADGVLAPDPENADAAAYPLPLVQYAVTPHDALPDVAKRTAMAQFLTYATTSGQHDEDLGSGVWPLPAELKAQAATSLSLIGATVPEVPTTAASGSSGGGALPRTQLPLNSLSPGRTPTLPRASGVLPPAVPQASPAAPAVATATASPTPTPVALPAFTVARSTPLHGLLPPVGVVALAALLCAAAYGSSGRPWPVALVASAAATRRAAQRVRRLPRLRR